MFTNRMVNLNKHYVVQAANDYNERDLYGNLFHLFTYTAIAAAYSLR